MSLSVQHDFTKSLFNIQDTNHSKAPCFVLTSVRGLCSELCLKIPVKQNTLILYNVMGENTFVQNKLSENIQCIKASQFQKFEFSDNF